MGDFGIIWADVQAISSHISFMLFCIAFIRSYEQRFSDACFRDGAHGMVLEIIVPDKWPELLLEHLIEDVNASSLNHSCGLRNV